jgi:hypothetical protein
VSVSYPLKHLDGIGPDDLAALRKAGIRTTGKLLEAAKDPKGRKQLHEDTKIDQRKLLAWANAADRMRVSGISKEYAKLLSLAGVETVRELRYRNPEHLAKRIAELNAKRKLVRLLPSEKAVGRIIDNAKKLPLKIKY